ncbi:MAG: phosphoadenylyl-sulfate reductase [Capsulimonadaceae bacterium]|nr:phosphoadenylyl-sulfate reductase [Capsulimonadaceae bacterium]
MAATDAPPNRDALETISKQFENSSPEQILRWAASTYGSRLSLATAFGAEGCALLGMLSQIPNEAYVFNLDTGYQFRETLELRERIDDKYGITVHYVRSEETVSQMEERFGGPIYGTDPNLCCHIRKVVPLRKVVAGFDAWISAIRRDQSPARANAPIVGWDDKFQLVKINPLARWTKRDVWEYILANDVPYNPLHDQGYPSIGCAPCTRAAANSADERDGRWAGTVKTECGLHI